MITLIDRDWFKPRTIYLAFMVFVVQKIVMFVALNSARLGFWFIEDRVRKPLTAYLNKAVL